MPKVLVAAHHAYVRSAIAVMLRDDSAWFVVAEAASGQVVLDRCRAEPWDVLLLDSQMPALSTLDVIQQLKHDCPRLRILLLAFYLDIDHIRACLDAGAAGCVAKERIPDELLRAIFTVLAGESYLSPVIAEQLRLNGADPSTHS